VIGIGKLHILERKRKRGVLDKSWGVKKGIYISIRHVPVEKEYLYLISHIMGIGFVQKDEGGSKCPALIRPSVRNQLNLPSKYR
jgi:hypothetical protein